MSGKRSEMRFALWMAAPGSARASRLAPTKATAEPRSPSPAPRWFHCQSIREQEKARSLRVGQTRSRSPSGYLRRRQ